MTEADVKEAAREFIEAARAIHYVSANTDVHNHGGIAGQAITPHCAWQCRDTGGRLVTRPDGSVYVEPGVPPHKDVMERYEAAEAALIQLLQEGS